MLTEIRRKITDTEFLAGKFLRIIMKIGRDIQQLHTDYDEVQKSLTGRLSIVQKANEMMKLGVKEDTKHPLPSFDDQQLET